MARLPDDTDTAFDEEKEREIQTLQLENASLEALTELRFLLLLLLLLFEDTKKKKAHVKAHVKHTRAHTHSHKRKKRRYKKKKKNINKKRLFEQELELAKMRDAALEQKQESTDMRQQQQRQPRDHQSSRSQPHAASHMNVTFCFF